MILSTAITIPQWINILSGKVMKIPSGQISTKMECIVLEQLYSVTGATVQMMIDTEARSTVMQPWKRNYKETMISLFSVILRILQPVNRYSMQETGMIKLQWEKITGLRQAMAGEGMIQCIFQSLYKLLVLLLSSKEVWEMINS